MKTCKLFFSKSLILESADEFRRALETKNACKLYGFCLLSCINHDYSAQRIMRFTEDYSAALVWLIRNEIEERSDLYGVVLGCDL